MDQWFVDTDDALMEVVAQLRGVNEYALDTEFHGEKTYYPKLALVQIAWDGGLALIDPLAISIAPLAEIVDSDSIMVVHAGDQDLAIMARATGANPRRMFDTQLAGGFLGMGTPSLLHLAERTVSVELAKGDRLTDWTKRPLSKEQCTYAAGDVEYLLAIADNLRKQLTELGRLEWTELECEERRQRDREKPDPRTAWWKIKGHRQLKAKSRGVAQEVCAWRERRAADLDQPTRFILSDLAMAGIIARPPRTRDELAAVRGLDGRVLKEQIANELLAAITQGAALSADELVLAPRDDADKSLGPAVAVIAAYLNQRASELKIEPSLLASRSDLATLLNTGDGRLATGWRQATIGEPISQLMTGERVIALRNGGRQIELVERERPIVS